MINLKNLLIILLLLPVTSALFAQNERELKQIFIEAESYFLYEEYKDALPLYLTLAKDMPYNYNIEFKAGVCYLNIPFSKNKAIPHLKEAAKQISIDYENKFSEINAPSETLFYLGDAYRINKEYEKAIQSYNDFLDIIDPDVYDVGIVHLSIAACENAMRFQRNMVEVEKVNLGKPVNSPFSERNAVISGNEEVIVFTRELQFYDAAFVSYKNEDGTWDEPINLMPLLQVDDDLYPSSISYEGNEIYFYRNDNMDGNIYVAQLIDGEWNQLKKLNDHINTKYWESHASVNKEGNKLYFTSNRHNEGLDLDIYVSHRQEDGEWGVPQRLSPAINSPFNENTPFISTDGKTLYFSSEGHQNSGGYDIFYSELVDGEWTRPQNLGFPINSPDHDLFFVPSKEKFAGYMSRLEDSSLGRTDIYKIRIIQ